MLLVGIPMYNARETIRDTLNSLCAQTKKNFIICICDDNSTDDCSDIIEEYSKRLHITTIHLSENRGPGMARQAIIDYNKNMMPKCDYITFVDADDMLYPRAIDVLYSEAKKNNADVVDSEIFCEQAGQDGFILDPNNSITWFHGKCYKSSYIEQFEFLPDLRYNEDSYFNLLTHLMTDNKYLVEEPLYLWRNNKKSLTRSVDDFNIEYNYLYFYSQLKACIKISETEHSKKLGATLANIYKSYEKICLFDSGRIEWANQLLWEMFDKESVINLFYEPKILSDCLRYLGQGEEEKDKIIFYPHSFNSWCAFCGIKLGE